MPKTARLMNKHPNWPQMGLAAVLFVETKRTKEAISLFPLRNFYRDEEEAQKDIFYFDRLLRQKQTRFKTREASILIPIMYKEEIELRPEYWDTPTVKFDYELRGKLFLDFLEKISEYEMLITTDIIKGKQVKYSVPMPIKLNNKQQEIEAFMQYSDWPVDKKAATAGIYTCGVPFGYDWKRGEMILPDEDYETKKLDN